MNQCTERDDGSMTKDMTKGNPLLLILGFCIPMVFGNVLQQFYNLADTAIVGKCLNSDALAAIGLTGAVCFLVIGFATGLCTGLSIPVAQAYGAGDMKLMRRYMVNAAYIATAACVVLTALTLVFCRPLLRLMDTPADILDMSASYLYVIFAGLAATILYNLLAGFLRAMGDSTTPLIFLAVSSVLNIGLDFLMILVFHLGVMGAGLATVLAQGISAVCCLYYMYRHFPVLTFDRDELPLHLPFVGKLCGIGLPMAFQFSITAIGSIILQTAINGFGPDIIASVSTAQKIQNVVGGPMESMGITMATYCGQNLGAGRIDRIRQGLRSSIFTTLIYAVLAYLFSAFLGQYFVYLFLSKDDPAFGTVLEYAMQYLRISGLFYPVLAVLFVLRNSLQGMGYSFLPMSAGIVELAARVFAVGVLIRAYGFTGVCLASPTAWVAADVLLISATVWAMCTLHKRVPNGAAQSVS